MSIKAIDRTSVHRITSGQVVIDLQTAVKELVENSLDAGATNVEVRFKNYGLASIEVIDNGGGISEDNYEALALKHHTSKLSSLADLEKVTTFGFRGEALSSLCALCASVVVSTATQPPMGVTLELESSGKIRQKSKAARQRGTTITLTQLFTPLPVRRKEFERHAKREYGKALSLLHAYALGPCARDNVRLTVSNQPDKGAKSVQIRTNGNSSQRDVITALWGPRALDNVVDLDVSFTVERDKATLKRMSDADTSPIQASVRGLISKFSVACGRAGSDRQFLYVNGRPCNSSKIQKAFNEVYRAFNATQSPLVIADFILPTDAYDVNVSPDKRTIFIHHEANLIEALKGALETAFAPARSTFGVSRSNSNSNPDGGSRSMVQTQLSTLVKNGRTASASTSSREKPIEVMDVGESEREDRQTEDNGNADQNADAQSRSGTESSVPVLRTPRKSEGPTAQPPARGEGRAEGEDEMNPFLIPVAPAAPPSAPSRTVASNGGRSTPPPSATKIQAAAPASTSPRGTSASEGDVVLQLDASSAAWAPTVKAGSKRPDVEKADEGSEHGGGERHRKKPRWWDEEEGVRSSSRSSSRPREDVPAEDMEDELEMDVDDGKISMSNSAKDPGSRDGDKRGSATLSRPRGGSSFSVRSAQNGSKSSASARQDLRSMLAGFSLPGSQPVATEEIQEVDELRSSDDEEEDAEKAELEADPEAAADEEDNMQVEMEGASDARLHAELRDLTQHSEKQSVAEAEGSSTMIDLTFDADSELFESSELSIVASTLISSVPNTDNDLDSEPPHRAEIIRTLADDGDISLRVDTNDIAATWRQLQQDQHKSDTLALARSADAAALREAGVIDGGESDEVATEALARTISKTDFAGMANAVVGQFNLGFIVARRTLLANADAKADRQVTGVAMDDLFIIDQHAADEKYNFETLQQTTRIKSQKLFRPQPLELTASDEILALEKMEMLRQNGFELESVNEPGSDGEGGSRLALTAQPVSKDTVFDMKDLEELIHRMRDAPAGTTPRCAKARAMFAMRACRKSVMIGMPLARGQMSAVVRHMGTMDQPWNCPHGRPTMRHLADIRSEGEKERRKVDWAAFS